MLEVRRDKGPQAMRIPEDALKRVKVGQRVKHFRLRRNGTYRHGTVVALEETSGWCHVKWDGKSGKIPVMIECLLTAELPEPRL
jgi:hypothetical protein